MKTNFLSHWKDRDEESLLSTIGRYTRFVSLSKLVLAGLALGLLTTLITFPLLESDDAGVRIAFTSTSKKQEEIPPAMIKPHFQGVDKHNQPYTVTADFAIQDSAEIVTLQALKADLALKDAAWISLSADSGRLDMKARTLLLDGDVHMLYDKGYEMRTQQAYIDINSKTAQGSMPVQGQGPLGTLKAAGFAVEDSGGVIRFTGPIQLRLYPGGA